MKKKIKDLTLEECKKICLSRKHPQYCWDCVLEEMCPCGKYEWFDDMKKKDLEKEVEVIK